MTIIGFVADRPLDFAPGSQYHYSNTDNIVVALIAEKATGLSYERVLHELVLDPLALRRTSMPLGYRMPAPYVHGYDNNVKGKRDDISEALTATLVWASGGMVSAPLDLTRFIRAYGGGKLFGGATRAAQLRFRAGNSEPLGPGVNEAGMGIFRYRTRCGTVYGHTGNFPGYTVFIATSPDGSRSVTIQANTQLSEEMGSTRHSRWCGTRLCSVCARPSRRTVARRSTDFGFTRRATPCTTPRVAVASTGSALRLKIA